MSDLSQGPGWWQASDGKWYSPEQASGGSTVGTVVAEPGTPQSAVAPQAFGAPLAEWSQRAIGLLLDIACIFAVVIAGVIVAAIVGAVSSTLGFLVSTIVYLVAVAAGFYIGFLNGATGQSPGKRLTGLKVISEETGQVIGGGMGIVRHIAHFVDSLVCYAGWLFPLWDPKKQTIADKIVKTVVVTGAPKKPFGPDIFKP